MRRSELKALIESVCKYRRPSRTGMHAICKHPDAIVPGAVCGDSLRDCPVARRIRNIRQRNRRTRLHVAGEGSK